MIVFALLIAVIGPYIAPHDPNFIQLRYAYVGPVDDHYLGFDGRGRDLLSRLLCGAQTAIFGAVAVAGISIAIGTVLAIVAAWRGGWLDNAIGAVLDVLFAFPGILIAVMAAAVFGPSLKTAVIALSVAYTPYIARVLRGAALRERAQLYISALEVQGLAGIAICIRHLVPNIIGLVVAQGTILFGYAMVDLAAISFIGLGVQSPQADWGVMVSEGRAGVLHGLPARVAVGGPLHRRRGRGRQPARRASRRPRAAGAAMTSLLEIENLTVTLPVEGEQRAVLRDVSLAIAAGEAVGLVGESGSGKSMTARAVARILPPGAVVEGRITFDERDVRALRGGALRQYRGEVAIVFQDPRAHTTRCARSATS